MNAIEISAIGIVVCTAINFVLFILIMYLALTIQGWKRDLDTNINAINEFQNTPKKIDDDVINPIKTDNSSFDEFFNTDKTIHEMLENPKKYEIGTVLKYVYESRNQKRITATDRSNQSKLVKLLQCEFYRNIMSYAEADSIAIWLDKLVNNQMEK